MYQLPTEVSPDIGQAGQSTKCDWFIWYTTNINYCTTKFTELQNLRFLDFERSENRTGFRYVVYLQPLWPCYFLVFPIRN